MPHNHQSLLLGTLKAQRAPRSWPNASYDLSICLSLEAGNNIELSFLSFTMPCTSSKREKCSSSSTQWHDTAIKLNQHINATPDKYTVVLTNKLTLSYANKNSAWAGLLVTTKSSSATHNVIKTALEVWGQSLLSYKWWYIQEPWYCLSQARQLCTSWKQKWQWKVCVIWMQDNLDKRSCICVCNQATANRLQFASLQYCSVSCCCA